MNEAVSLSGRSMIFAGGIGFATPEAKTAADALEAAGLNFNMVKRAAVYAKGDGTIGQDTGRFDLVREDTDEKFAQVGGRYHIIQNHEMFEWADHLVDGAGAAYESAWSLYGGREIGLTMRFPETVLIGGEDPHARYLLLRGSHTGKSSVRGMITDVRLFCTNMLNTASRQAKSRVLIPHLSNATGKLANAREVLELSFKYDKAFNEQMEQLIVKQVSDDAFRAMMEPVLKRASFGGREAAINEMVSLRADSETLQDQFRSTAYGAFQAVTEYTDWVHSFKTPKGRVEALLDGRVLKVKNETLVALSS